MKTEENRKKIRFTVKLTEKERNNIEKLSLDKGMSLSAYVRERLFYDGQLQVPFLIP